MPKIKFIDASGECTEVDATEGDSLMQTALNNDVEGIVGDCGGACSCATCHCYIQEDFVKQLEPAEDMEVAMLEMAIDPTENSRLSCQVPVTSEMEGLEIRLPESQF